MRRVDHGIEVRHLAPGAIEPIDRVGERLHEIVPGGRRSLRCYLLDRCTGLGQQRIDRGCHMGGSDLGKARQSGEVEQRIAGG